MHIIGDICFSHTLKPVSICSIDYLVFKQPPPSYTKIRLHPFVVNMFLAAIMAKEAPAQLSVGRNYLFLPKLQQCNRWSLGMVNNFIAHFTGYVIIHPCWD